MVVRRTLREATADYDAQQRAGGRTRARQKELVDEVLSLVTSAAPSSTCDIYQLGPRDYRINVEVDTEDEEDRIDEVLGGRTTDILVDHDVWIVVIPHTRATDD